MRGITRVCAIGLAAAATVSCSSGDTRRSGSGQTMGGSQPPVVIRPLFAADYVAAAASIDLYEIRSSELALTRASSPRLREFARMMLADHGGTSAQLSLAGRRLNLVPPAVMRPAQQALFEELSATGDFDAVYRRQQMAVHQQALALHRNFAARGESPTLRPVAANAAAVVDRHLRQLRAL